MTLCHSTKESKEISQRLGDASERGRESTWSIEESRGDEVSRKGEVVQTNLTVELPSIGCYLKEAL